jgi:nucleoid DNA-binding protein
MNFSQLLLEFLKKNGSVSLAGFGTFFLQTITAALDEEGKHLLPPGTEIAFDPSKNEDAEKFVRFLAAEKNTSESAAEEEISKQVVYWNSALEKNETLKIENVGTFYLADSKLLFSGNRLENLSPAFFGLEEINISKIKKGFRSGKKPYAFVRTAAWILPLILLISGLTYMGIEKPEMIFGKKSDLTTPPKKDVLTVKKNTPKVDSLAPILVPDSTLADSTKAIVSPVKPAKKWSSNSSKKSKWKKSKKRHNP